jgi:hypothetical protein
MIDEVFDERQLAADIDKIKEGTQSSSSMEDLASQYGWNKEGEKTAEEFIKVAMDKFPKQSKKIDQLFRTVEEMKVHMSKAEKAAYERAKADIEAQRRQAIQQGDVDLVEELDKAKADLIPAMEVPEVHPAIADFEERNKEWLEGTSYEAMKMQKWVQEHGAILGKKRLPVEEHMAILEDHLKKEFPKFFAETVEDDDIVSPVAPARDTSDAKPAGKGKKFGFNDLTPAQKQIARDFEAVGFMKIDDYIKSLVSHGELK